MKVGFISLGCAKNQVNCEQMLWQTYDAGHDIALEAEDCDIAVVNTCGFSQEAKQEALDEIAHLGKLKQEGRLGKIIVSGCMAQRYQAQLETLCPEADGFLGCGGYENIADVIEKVQQGLRPSLFGDIHAPIPETNRVIIGSEFSAYLRIAEGCDNRCSYCMIPSIRGNFRSRPQEEIIREAESLVKDGIRELIVVAQDITRYGLDLYGRRSLTDLLRALCQVEGLSWIRLHYLYPDEIDDELIRLIAREEKIVKYIDLPIQHISTPVLRAMNRRGSGDDIRALFEKLRREIPDLVIRTSLICGFPGETEEDFEELCDFLRSFRLERAGIFAFSLEEGSPAASMPSQIEPHVVRRRLELLTGIQLEVIDRYCQAQIGKTVTVLYDGIDAESGRFLGHSGAESPGTDGVIYIESAVPLTPGLFYPVSITDVDDGELIGMYQEVPL